MIVAALATLLLALPQGLHQAAERGDADRVRGLIGLGQNPDIASKKRGGRTPLHCAAEHGHAEVVALLVGAGVRLDARTDEGWTPLHLAAASGYADAAQELVAGGAPLEAPDGLVGDRPLHLAADNGWREVVVELVGGGAEVDGPDAWGRTPLIRAALFSQDAVVTELLERGAKVDARSGSGRTALHAAAANGDEALYAQLVAAGADPARPDGFGRAAAELLERALHPPAPRELDEAEREGIDAGVEGLPRFVAWLYDSGYRAPGVVRPEGLELAVWPDGVVLYAADPELPSSAMRVGRLYPSELALLARELDESGLPTLDRAGVSGPHGSSLLLNDLRGDERHCIGVDTGFLRELDGPYCWPRSRRVMRAWLLARDAFRRARPSASCALEDIAPDGRFRGWHADVRFADWFPR